MEYCYLGNSGLEVSRFALGAIPFGTVLDLKTCEQIADMYLEAGGNLIDTSNLYGGGSKGNNTEMAGTSEKTVGKLIKGRRDKFVVASKGYWLMEDEWTPNSVGLSRTYLTKNLDNSLKRLGTDYIDLYQCHNYDPYTPIEETMRVLDDFVRAGKIRYVGVSNWDGWQVVYANQHAKQNGLTPIISNQIWYNLGDRFAEFSILPACEQMDCSIIAWGAFAEGFLCGKYRSLDDCPAPGAKLHLAVKDEMWSWDVMATERNFRALDVAARIAEKRGKSVANIVARWLMDCGKCNVILIGASRLEQFENNLEMLNFKLTEDEVEALREASEQRHPYPTVFWDIFCRKESPLYGGLR